MNNSTICLSFDIILSEERQGVGAWENIYRRKEMKGWEGEFWMGGKRGKWGEIMQKCLIFCNQERARGRRPRKKGRRNRECKEWQVKGLDPPLYSHNPPLPPAPIHNMKKGYWSFSYETQSWKFLTNNVNKLLITTHPIRNLWTQAVAEMNKRGFLRQVSLSFSPQSPLSFPPFPFPFNACMQATSTRDFIPYLV